jgi:ferric iron reductase protein FhuF
MTPLSLSSLKVAMLRKTEQQATLWAALLLHGQRQPNSRCLTVETTIRIARVHRHCCLSWRAGDLQFLWTVGDR